METKHTPGPWEWCGNDLSQAENPYKEVICNEVSCGAYCLGGSWSPGLSNADRALIAAAPDLLEALEAVLSDVEDIPRGCLSSVRQARAALAKAREKARAL